MFTCKRTLRCIHDIKHVHCNADISYQVPVPEDSEDVYYVQQDGKTIPLYVVNVPTIFVAKSKDGVLHQQ